MLSFIIGISIGNGLFATGRHDPVRYFNSRTNLFSKG